MWKGLVIWATNENQGLSSFAGLEYARPFVWGIHDAIIRVHLASDLADVLPNDFAGG